MGPKQFAGVMSLVRRAKAARKGEKFDEKLDKQLVELVESAAKRNRLHFQQAACSQMMELLIQEKQEMYWASACLLLITTR